jgi:hypothetical protein
MSFYQIFDRTLYTGQSPFSADEVLFSCRNNTKQKGKVEHIEVSHSAVKTRSSLRSHELRGMRSLHHFRREKCQREPKKKGRNQTV